MLFFSQIGFPTWFTAPMQNPGGPAQLRGQSTEVPTSSEGQQQLKSELLPKALHREPTAGAAVWGTKLSLTQFVCWTMQENHRFSWFLPLSLNEFGIASFTQRNLIKQLVSANVINQDMAKDHFVSSQISNPICLLFPGLLRLSHLLSVLGSIWSLFLATGDSTSSLKKSH